MIRLCNFWKSFNSPLQQTSFAVLETEKKGNTPAHCHWHLNLTHKSDLFHCKGHRTNVRRDSVLSWSNSLKTRLNKLTDWKIILFLKKSEFSFWQQEEATSLLSAWLAHVLFRSPRHRSQNHRFLWFLHRRWHPNLANSIDWSLKC